MRFTIRAQGHKRQRVSRFLVMVKDHADKNELCSKGRNDDIFLVALGFVQSSVFASIVLASF